MTALLIALILAPTDASKLRPQDEWRWTAHRPAMEGADTLGNYSRERAALRLRRADFLSLARRCAPTSPVVTLAAIAKVESGYDPIALRDNRTGLAYHPRSISDAAKKAAELMERSPSVDIGIMQINSRNLSGLRLSVLDALDPCRNVSAAAKILERSYTLALRKTSGQPLLQSAYSAYNTGRLSAGFKNGYVDQVVTAGSRATE